MRVLKNILIILLIIIFIGGGTISNASIKKATKKDLEKAFEELIEASKKNNDDENLSSDFDVKIMDDVMEFKLDGKKYTLKYDLTDNPTFTYEVTLKNGMSYDEYQEESGMTILPLYGYMAIAINEGVDPLDAIAYVMMNMFSLASQQSINVIGQGDYIYYDSTKVEISDLEKAKKIKKSEFGNNVIDFVNTVYKKGQTFDDKKEINSFVWTISKKDTKSDECTLVSTLSIKKDAKLLDLKGYCDKIGKTIKENANNTNDNNTTNTDKTLNEVSKKDTTANIDTIPKSGVDFGIKDILQIIIVVSILAILIMLITSKKDKD